MTHSRCRRCSVLFQRRAALCRRSWSLLVVVLTALLVWPVALPASDSAAQSDLPLPPAVRSGAFTPGHVLVGWNEDTVEQDRSDLLAGQGWQVLRSIDELDVDILLVPKGEEQAAVAILQAYPTVAYAELDYLAYAAGVAPSPARQAAPPLSAQGIQPSDTFWTAQWNLRRVQAPLAWEITQGASATVVAVVDSGIDLAHPEFAGRVQTGFDYVEWDTVPQDQYGHGTHVAGVIAAAGNNGLGVAGSAWNVQVVPLRVLDRVGVGTASNVALAIQAAANRRVAVINLSLALSEPSTTVQNAIIAASNNDILLIASTGNDSQPGQLPAPVSYPAAYPQVVAVAAVTHWEDRAAYSNGGPEVEVAAPGGEASDPIFSTSLGGGYAMLYGTSIATAHVTGAAALLRGYAPQWSAVSVRDVLRNTADKIGSAPYVAGRNDRLGYGRINAAAALRWSMPPIVSFTPAAPSLLAAAGQPLPTTSVELANPSRQPLSWLVASVSPAWLRVDEPQSGSLVYPATARLQIGLHSLPPSGLSFASIWLRTTDPFGNQGNDAITVRVEVADQVHRSFLPLVGRGMAAAEWIDMSTAQGLSLGDDGAQTLALAFAFPFYGRSYSQVYVHANGFLSFGQAYPGPDYAANHCLPSILAPNGAIFALWDDLHPGLGGRVAYHNRADYLAVEWQDVPHKSGGASTFQVILRPSGLVRINYGPMIQTAGATVGAESWDASIAWPVACNRASDPPYPGQSVLWNTAMP